MKDPADPAAKEAVSLAGADFGRTAAAYARWRDPVPGWVFDLLQARGALGAGVPVLDLACGTGTACREMAARGATVTGIDRSPAMIAEARRWDDRASYLVGEAEAVPLPNGSVLLATAMRAWHWFDRGRVLAGLGRLLRPGGWLCVVDSAFRPCPLVEATFARIARYNTAARRSPGSKAETAARRHGLPVPWFAEWEAAGLGLVEGWDRSYTLEFTHAAWRGRVRALSPVVDLPDDALRALDADLEELLRETFPGSTLAVPHRCVGVLLRDRRG